MTCVAFELGPLDGSEIDLGPQPPEKLSVGLSPAYGGPGIACYDLSREAGVPRYAFSGWATARHETPPSP